MAAILNTGLSHISVRGHSSYFFSLTFIDDKSSEKQTFTPHGPSAAIDDPTIWCISVHNIVTSMDQVLQAGLRKVCTLLPSFPVVPAAPCRRHPVLLAVNLFSAAVESARTQTCACMETQN